MPIKAGRYIITNVKQGNLALLPDPNDGTTLQASYKQDIPGEQVQLSPSISSPKCLYTDSKIVERHRARKWKIFDREC